MAAQPNDMFWEMVDLARRAPTLGANDYDAIEALEAIGQDPATASVEQRIAAHFIVEAQQHGQTMRFEVLPVYHSGGAKDDWFLRSIAMHVAQLNRELELYPWHWSPRIYIAPRPTRGLKKPVSLGPGHPVNVARYPEEVRRTWTVEEMARRWKCS